MVELTIITMGIMIIIYALDSVFHLGIFDKLEKLLEK